MYEKRGEKIEVARLWRNVSAKGNEYFTGFFTGSSKLLVMEDKRAEPGAPSWVVYVVEKPPKPAAAPARAEHRPAVTAAEPHRLFLPAPAKRAVPFDDPLDA